MLGHRLMKSCVENGNLRDIGHNLLAGLNAHEVGRVVQRAKRDALGDGRDDGVVNKHALGEFFTAVYNAVTDGTDFAKAADDAVVFAGELFNNGINGLGMGRHGYLGFKLFLAVNERCVLKTAVNTNAFTDALSGDRLGLHVEQLVFQ